MQPNEIDWSKAPDGATHWTHEARHHWLKINDSGQYYWWAGAGWHEYPDSPNSKTAFKRVENAIPRPQENEMKPHPQAEVLHMIADGHQGPWEASYDGFTWDKTSVPLEDIAAELQVRLAPRTIRIGDVEVPAPERVAPEVGEEYWTIGSYRIVMCEWDGTQEDYRMLREKRIWLKQEHAQQAFDAITSLLGGE